MPDRRRERKCTLISRVMGFRDVWANTVWQHAGAILGNDNNNNNLLQAKRQVMSNCSKASIGVFFISVRLPVCRPVGLPTLLLIYLSGCPPANLSILLVLF